MSIEQKMCKEKIFQLQSMLNVIGCINQWFAFWYFVSGLDIQLEQSENDNPVHTQKKKVAGCKIRQDIYCFFFRKIIIRTRGSVVKASSRESGDLGLIPAGR